MNYGSDRNRGQVQGAGAMLGGGGEWGGCMGAVASQVDTQRKPELVSELDRMDRAIGVLDVMLEGLAQRLEGALRPPEPADPVDQVKESCPSSGYASTLYAQSARVSYLAGRVQDLLRRLEV